MLQRKNFSREQVVEYGNDGSELTGTKLFENKFAQDVVAHGDHRLTNAIKIIEDTYGDVVTLKPKTLLKLGRSDQVDNATRTTLMELPDGVLNETYLTDNLITTVSSSETADTQNIILEGHTIDGNGNFTFVEQSVTLNGQNQVTLLTPLARSTRAYNNDNFDFNGDIYFYETGAATDGVPNTPSEVHLLIKGSLSRNQSFKGSTTISNNDYWIITQVGFGIEEKQASFVDVELEIRFKGKVFRENLNLSSSASGGKASETLDPPIIAPKNCDVRIRSLASAAGTSVSGFINGYLAAVNI